MTRRPLPDITPWTRPFWTGGAEGELRLPECACGRLLHPSLAVCDDCHADVEKWTPVAGDALVVGVTVNHQLFMPGFDPPYVIAVVSLDAAPHVRLTTNLVDVDPSGARVGLRVTVRFDEQDGVWFPLFAPSGQADDAVGAVDRVPLPTVTRSRPVSAQRFEDRVAITGIGMSQVGRRLGRHPLSLTVEACRAAVADAGLELDDIDGLATWPGALPISTGITEGGISALEPVLGIRPVWHSGGMETSGQAGSVVEAMLAVASGLCRHVLCFRTVWEATHTDLMRTGQLGLPGAGRVPGDMQWRLPFGASSAANWIAMIAAQYQHRFGVGREALAAIAVNGRANAARNPVAVYRDPMSLDDYYAARPISTPLGLYDCDVPCDGAVAIVVSAAETADDRPNRPVRVEAVGTRITETPSWDQGTLTHLPSVFGPASHLWTRTDLRPADMDVAELYDGFSFNCLSWIEALGLCGIGEATEWLGDGSRIALDGELPLNTHGGQLSAGRTHGYGFLHEAVVQLRGDAGERQVAGARAALVAAGGGIPAGCFILRTD